MKNFEIIQIKRDEYRGCGRGELLLSKSGKSALINYDNQEWPDNAECDERYYDRIVVKAMFSCWTATTDDGMTYKLVEKDIEIKQKYEKFKIVNLATDANYYVRLQNNLIVDNETFELTFGRVFNNVNVNKAKQDIGKKYANGGAKAITKVKNTKLIQLCNEYTSRELVIIYEAGNYGAYQSDSILWETSHKELRDLKSRIRSNDMPLIYSKMAQIEKDLREFSLTNCFLC